MSKFAKMMAGNLAEMLADDHAKGSLARLSQPGAKQPPAIGQEDPAPYGAPIDTLTQQPNSTAELDSRAGEVNRQTQHASSTGKPSRQGQRPNSTAKLNRQTQQPNSTAGLDNQEPITIKKRKRNPLTSDAQKILAAYFAANGTIVATYQVISDESGVCYGTVRTVVEKFVTQGWLTKTLHGGGRDSALRLTPGPFLIARGNDNSTAKLNMPTQQANLAVELDSRTRQSNSTVELDCRNSPLKIDRKNLSISSETLRTAWPGLARTGFGLEQIEQIHATLAQLGKSTDRIVQGLDHAEWELANGKMLDKTGQPVADPCAWVYRSLASQGYYRRPAGYVSVEEQAERDAADEAKALAKSREEARQARFRAWLQGLSGEEREKALAGRIGPEEAWLKKVWAQRGEPN